MLGITSAFGYGYNTAKDYLFPQTPKKNDKENTPLLDLELGEGSYPSLFPPNLLGTVKITSKPIITSEQTKMKTPPNPPGTAAGDPDKFMPRQEFLLKEQYKDIEGRSTTTVGEAIYAILTKPEHVEGKPSIIDEKTASDIGLVSTGKTVISETFKPHTKIGDAYIHLNLSRPSADLNIVLGRQEVIKAITEDSSLETKLSTELTKMAPGENYLLSCRDGRKQLPGSVSSLYYKMHPRINDIANNNSLALDISALGTIFKKVTGTVMQGISGVALSAYALTETARAFTEIQSPEILEDYAARFTSSTPVGVVGTLAMTPNVSIINAMVASTAGAYSLMGLQSTYAWAKADTAMLPLMREILSSIATYYKGMKTLHSLLNEHPEIVNRLEHFQKLDDFIRNAQNSKDLHRLFQTLESFSFNPENNYLFRPGEVLLAWELLHSGGGKKGKGKQSTENSPPTAGDIIRAAFDEALPAIGEIDALLSAAKLVKESEHSSAKYCFPSFILNSDQPILNLQEVWNPMIIPDNAVPNSISLGGGSPSKGAILTGPNGGGKSSFGKAILIAVCMSSFGICPAKEATLTPFNYVRSSMNITDSIENQESLYQAQCSLVGKIVSDVESLPSNIFSLTVLDELFTQTKSEEGSALAQASAMSLSAIPGNINILVTHFRSIPEAIGDQIGEDGKSTPYQNYKMEEGSFRLERGIYEGVNAFDVARDFGVGSKILDLAQNTLNSRK